jgi:hypothetical protein
VRDVNHISSGLGSQKGKSEKGESKKAIAFLVRPVAFLFFGL